jgi:hypothetical protein
MDECITGLLKEEFIEWSDKNECSNWNTRNRRF